ncbi:MAG: glycosyltransferase [Dokdonella sp.]
MRVLFITSRFPGDLRRGDQLRAYHQLRCLSARHAITLLAFDHVGSDPALVRELEACCERVIMVDRKPAHMLVRLLGALGGSTPLQAAMYASPTLHAELTRLLESSRFDLVHLQMARLGALLPHLRQLPCVLDLIDALSLNMARRAEFDHGPMRYLARIEASRLPAYERMLCAQVRYAAVSAAPDQKAIGSVISNLRLVSNGVDLDLFPFAPHPRHGADIVFVGNLGYFPNVDAATWFAHEVMPLLLARSAHATLSLVGARPPVSLRRLAARAPHVQMVGPVAQVHPYLARAAVAVAPMRAGSGQQIKIFEAMAAGTPVVATSLAAAGLEVEHGRHLLVADGAEAFAAAVVRLLDDPDLAATLAKNARALVKQRYTWACSNEALEKLWLMAVAQ